MMNILFAYNTDHKNNDYIFRLIELTQKLNDAFVYSSLEEFWEPTRKYDFIIINWPDYLFRWKVEITSLDLKKIKNTLNYHKKNETKIITFVHDEKSHFSNNKNLQELFNICYSESNTLVHLGNFSLEKYKEKYPTISHKLVYHPLYNSFDLDKSFSEIRKKMKIRKKDFLIMVPGSIRKKDEYDFAVKVYKKINIKNKKLFFLRGNYFINSRFNYFNIWYLLNKIYLKYIYKIFINEGYLSNEKLSDYLTISNLILLPRIDILNSGNITLCSQFNKLIVGFESGNISNWLDILGHIKIRENDDLQNLNKLIDNKITQRINFKNKVQSISNDLIIIEQLKDVFV
ncbi:hypothetical protein [Cloacibacterium normanense]|uniref:Glycosyl transferases group 1 family protein n=1 Tax=Cloacibacterium normanense TaxID=237258 RepID=A0A1E5UFS9_9FLAO|nr:hypothetical protein [Cloacibacterium normanense]AZI69921.1 hypothetical protein EB819_08575 [Cloacibacterium normanense]OEL11739.1 hypothetical protein BHF72_1775 [Cloacibacterium normanense]SDO57219.1 hypothetical protein SAMN04489756_11048 [Cloacibacterium normanense]